MTNPIQKFVNFDAIKNKSCVMWLSVTS